MQLTVKECIENTKQYNFRHVQARTDYKTTWYAKRQYMIIPT